MGMRRSTYRLYAKVRDGALHVEINGRRNSWPLPDRANGLDVSVIYLQAVDFATKASDGTLTAGQRGDIGKKLSADGYHRRSP